MLTKRLSAVRNTIARNEQMSRAAEAVEKQEQQQQMLVRRRSGDSTPRSVPSS